MGLSFSGFCLGIGSCVIVGVIVSFSSGVLSGEGVLFGLNNWSEDVEALIQHGKSLEKQYGISPYIIGLPRFKDAHSIDEEVREHITLVSDDEYKLACKMYKNNFPKTMLFINTREKLELNLDVCSENDLFTINCGTYPGAYINPEIIEQGNEQFHTHQYNREIVLQEIRKKRFTPLFDWNDAK